MDSVVTIELPRHLVDAARSTPNELKIELAIHLYEQRRLGDYHYGNFVSF
jgi:hypothetical protein